MSQPRPPPPEPAPCLVRPYPSSQKGGTLIAEDVTDRVEHRRRLCDPDGYRPAECPRCHHRVLHVHDYIERLLVADAVEPKVGIIRYSCAGCGAVWRILPAFVARHLWRSWDTVKANTLSARAPPSRPPSQPRVPARTLLRWWARLMASAMALVQLFGASWDALLIEVAGVIGRGGTREALVYAYAAKTGAEALGNPLARVAGLVHRLMPGVRLM
jgi:hypothetical protein